MEKNQKILAIAFRTATAKRAKLLKLNVEHDMSEDAIKALTISLAEKKAATTNTTVESNLEGQEWYVRSLVKFAGMTAKEQLEFEYNEAFPDNSSYDELLAALEDQP